MTRVHCTCSGLKTWTSDTMIPDSSTVPQAVHTESALKIESNSTVVFKFDQFSQSSNSWEHPSEYNVSLL